MGEAAISPGGPDELAIVWRDATEEITDEIVSAQQRAYLRETRLRAIVEDTALLAVPDAFTRDQIEMKLRPAITEALSRRLGRAIQVAVTLTPSDRAGEDPLTGHRSTSLVSPESPINPAGPPTPRAMEQRWPGYPDRTHPGPDYHAGYPTTYAEPAIGRVRPMTSPVTPMSHRPEHPDGHHPLAGAPAGPPTPTAGEFGRPHLGTPEHLGTPDTGPARLRPERTRPAGT